MATTTATQVQQLYVGLLGRAADQGGLNWWVDQVTTGGKTIEDLRASFVTSTEYTTTYGAAATRADLVTSIYQNLFERTPTADEVKYWAETDTRPADQLVAAFLEFASTGDQQTIDNKVFVANTYTATVGDTNFDKGAAAASIANVDGTAASVATATTAIANGTLTGQVPAVGLINALAAAQTAEAAVQTGNTAAVDALVSKLAANVAAGTATDLLPTNATYAQKVAAIVTDSNTFRTTGFTGSTDSTTVLTAKAGDAATALTAAQTALTVAADKTAAAAYQTAVANEATALTAKTTAVDKAAVIAGLGTETGIAALLTAHGAGTTAASLYAEYVAASTADRATIDTDFKTSAYYNSTFKAAAAKDGAYVDAVKTTLTAQDALDTNASLSTKDVDGVTITSDSDTGGNAGTNAFLTAVNTKAAADLALSKAQAADVDVAAVKAVTDANKAANAATVKAGADLATFNSSNTAVKAVALATENADANVKESFYFATKAAFGSDFTIGTATASTHFGAGDSIVLGTDVTYNSGALTTGDNNKAEFFLVQKGNDALVVVETSVYGSSTVTHTATGDAVAVDSPAAAVITLTGVNVADLSVNGGVISHVAAAVA